MSADPHAPPSIKEELDRKTTDMLVDLCHAMEQDHIEPVLADAQAHTIWKLTAGLVSNDVSNLAEQLATQAQQAKLANKGTVERVYLRHPQTGDLARFTYSLEKPGMTLDFFCAQPRAPVSTNTPPGAERRAQMRTLIQALVARGYQPI